MWDWLTSSDAANLGQFFGSVLTAVSVLLALYIIFRDRRRSERAQADLVSASIREHGFEYVTVTNNSNARIISPYLYVITRTEKEWQRYIKREPEEWMRTELKASAPKRRVQELYYFAERKATMKPGVSKSVMLMTDSYPAVFYRVIFAFTDAAGKEWYRDVTTNKYLSERQRKQFNGRAFTIVREEDAKKYRNGIDEEELLVLNKEKDPHHGGDQAGGS